MRDNPNNFESDLNDLLTTYVPCEDRRPIIAALRKAADALENGSDVPLEPSK